MRTVHGASCTHNPPSPPPNPLPTHTPTHPHTHSRTPFSDNELAARLVKGKIEKTTLGQISRSIYEIYAPDSCHIQVREGGGRGRGRARGGLTIYEIYPPDSCQHTPPTHHPHTHPTPYQINLDMHLINTLHLDIDAHSIRQRILKGLPGQTRPSVLRSLGEKHVQLNHSKVS